jgi:Ca2+-transporting ATPase
MQLQDPLDFESDPATIPDVIIKSNLNRKISAKLTTPYNIMNTFFFRRSVEKAFQIDEYPSGLSLSLNKSIDASPPFIIMAVDDVIFIVNAMIQKSLSTSQKEILAHVVPTIDRVLGSDFVGMIQRKMRDESYPKPLVQGGFPPEDKIITFIVLINSLDMANDYLARIISTNLGVNPDLENSLTKSSPVRDAFPLPQDAAFVANSLSSLLTSFTTKTTELLNEGLQVLFNKVIRLRLRPVLAETFRDVDYSLSEEEFAEAAAQTAEYDGSGNADGDSASEMVPRRFAHGWDQLMRPISRIMTPKTFAALLDLTAQYLAKQLEKRVWSSSGTSSNNSAAKTKMSAFGALRMERDLSHIAGVVARGNYAVREVFARVAQVLMVANMEEEEWDEILAGGDDGDEEEGGILWVLTGEERRKARKLVGD